MKKLVFMFVAIAAISFASCGDTTKKAAGNDTNMVDTNMVDTNMVDTNMVDTNVVK